MKKKVSSKKASKEKPSYILFGAKGCGNIITECFLKYAKIPYEYRELQWDDKEDWPKIIGRYNSLSQVPTLVLPNEEVLTETLATAVHANTKRKGLIPTNKEADKFWRWAIFIVANIYPTFTIKDNAAKLVSSEESQKQLSEAIMRRRKFEWIALEEQCGEKWFLGNTFSAIDIYLGVMIYWTPGKEWFEKHCPNIYAVAQRIKKTTPYKKLIETNFE